MCYQNSLFMQTERKVYGSGKKPNMDILSSKGVMTVLKTFTIVPIPRHWSWHREIRVQEKNFSGRVILMTYAGIFLLIQSWLKLSCSLKRTQHDHINRKFVWLKISICVLLHNLFASHYDAHAKRIIKLDVNFR